jgi:hypothetical protein
MCCQVIVQGWRGEAIVGFLPSTLKADEHHHSNRAWGPRLGAVGDATCAICRATVPSRFTRHSGGGYAITSDAGHGADRCDPAVGGDRLEAEVGWQTEDTSVDDLPIRATPLLPVTALGQADIV